MIVPLHIIEGPPISFFPDGPHQAEGASSPSSLFSCPQRIHANPGGFFSQKSALPIAPQKGRRSEVKTFWPSRKTEKGDLCFPPYIYTKSTCWGCSNQISSGGPWWAACSKPPPNQTHFINFSIAICHKNACLQNLFFINSSLHCFFQACGLAQVVKGWGRFVGASRFKGQWDKNFHIKKKKKRLVLAYGYGWQNQVGRNCLFFTGSNGLHNRHSLPLTHKLHLINPLAKKVIIK